LGEDHAKLHSDAGSTEWNNAWRKWIGEQTGDVTKGDLLKQIDEMKRSHGLVDDKGKIKMGSPVTEIDGMPYSEWEKERNKKGHRKQWRQENGGKTHWEPSDAERSRNRNDADARDAAKKKKVNAPQPTETFKPGKLKKVGKIIGGMLPFIGYFFDAQSSYADYEDQGAVYAAANNGLDYVPFVEWVKGVADIGSVIVTGNDFLHPEGLDQKMGDSQVRRNGDWIRSPDGLNVNTKTGQVILGAGPKF